VSFDGCKQYRALKEDRDRLEASYGKVLEQCSDFAKEYHDLEEIIRSLCALLRSIPAEQLREILAENGWAEEDKGYCCPVREFYLAGLEQSETAGEEKVRDGVSGEKGTGE
jgi:hypothetical protein